MGETHSTPQVQIEIDQELFLDSVQEGSVIEDAAVATEVTAFERVTDTYVLEGAIVFSGYTRHPEQEDAVHEERGLDALALDDESTVGHFHHRLPFVLQVPMKAQPRGIVNVNSRISSWSLEVISAGWIRIRGDLTLIGLNGNEGYHFDCGAQEEGDLLFHSPWVNEPEKGAREEYEVEQRAVQENGERRDAKAIQLVQGAKEDGAFFANPIGVTGTQNEVRHGENAAPAGDGDKQKSGKSAYPKDPDGEETVRSSGNHGTDDEEGDNSARATDTTDSVKPEVRETDEGQPENTEGEEARDFTSEALHRLDRLFGKGAAAKKSGVQEPPAENSPGVSRRSKETAAEVAKVNKESDGEGRDVVEPGRVVEFDFEHQLDLGQPSVREPQAGGQSSPHAPARQSDGLEIVVGHQDRGIEVQGDEPEGTEQLERNMWSFVDFDKPDTTYTLRYVIVTEAETVEQIAVREQCSRDELARLNQLATDALVKPGQSLVLPQPHRT